MRISFDLDDTLICYQPETPSEPLPPWYRRFFAPKEPLRKGSRLLIQRLGEMGWDIWVYTTSNRHPPAVRRWLWSYGIKVSGVINQQIHSHYLHNKKSSFLRPSKNPRVFGIDLHVDNSLGVQIEGEQYGFPVIVVSPEDDAWDEKILIGAKLFKWECRSVVGKPQNKNEYHSSIRQFPINQQSDRQTALW